MTRRDGKLLALLFSVSAVLFLHPFLLGRTHAAGDVLYSFQPWLTFAAQELQRGKLPLWNSFSACGEPFLANPQTMLFFPPAQFFWAFGFADAWRLHLLFAEALLLACAFLLARPAGRAGAALAALTAAWGGFTVTLWEFPGALATMPFVLLALLFARRRAWAGAPFIAALLFFAGYTQFAYYAVLAGGLLAVRRPRDGALWAAGAAAGALLALPQILPTWEAVRQSIRAGIDAGTARQYLLTPIFFVKFLLPDLHDKTALPYRTAAFDNALWPIAWNWLNTFYVGLPALALAAAGWGRRTAAWAALGAGAVLLAMGAEPLFSLFRLGVPGARYMTHFSNAMLIAVTAAGLMAAEGVRAWPRKKQNVRIWAGVLLLFAAAVALSPALRTALAGRLLGTGPLTPAQDALVRASGLKAAALLGLFLAATALLRRPWTAVLALALADLWLFGRDVQPLFSSDFFHAPVPLARSLQATEARFSVDPAMMAGNARPMDGATMEEGYQSLRQALFPNMALPFRVPHTWAYEVFGNKRAAQVRRAVSLDRPLGPIMDFLGARNIVAARPLERPARLLAERPNVFLYENPGALPRLTRVREARVFPDDGERLSYMTSSWDPKREVLLESGAGGTAAGTDGPPSWAESPGKLTARGSGGGWLVYSEVDDGGWETYVDGKKSPLLRADHAFQAVALPAGDWRADFLYRPKTAFAGFGAGVFLWMAGAGAGLVFLKKS